MSIFDQTRELLKNIKSKTPSFSNVFAPVAAYNAVKTISTPQFRQQFDQQITQPTRSFVQQNYSTYIKSPSGEYFPKAEWKKPNWGIPNVRNQQELGKFVRESKQFGTELGMNVAGGAPTSVIGSIAKSSLDAKALKPLLPEIRNIINMVGRKGKVANISIPQMTALENAVAKIRGTNSIKNIRSLSKTTDEYFEGLRAVLLGAEDQILNPTLNVGFNIRSIRGKEAMTPIKNIVKTKAEQLGRISPQLEGKATKGAGIPVSQVETPQVGGVGAGIPSSTDIITDPVQKVISLLKEAKPMRAEQEALYSAERARRSGAIAGIGKNVKGEAGYFAQLSKLKGELPKVQFERIRNGLKQTDIDTLFNKVEDANITPFEKISAKSGLAKLLGAEGGQIPVESELKLLSEIFPPEFIQAIQAKRPFMQRLWSGIEGALNLPRSIMATADLSAPLRQGFFFISRPKQWIPAFKDMFKYAGSEKAYLGLMDDIKARPNYLKIREAKLALTDMSPNLLAREEEFMSNLAEKIPGFGALAKGSNRAYSGFLNKLRADVFDDLVSKAEIQGIKLQGKTLEDLGSFINSATGRGNLGKTLQKAAPILNGVFFSPRLMASRINLLNPATYIKYDPFVRKEALKSLIGTGSIAATILGIAKLSGAEVGNDPRSADFGKIKVGNTRYDILGGFQQYIKLLSQLATGQVVSSTTGKVVTLGEGYKPLTRKDILMRFFESKTSPVASFIISLMTGQTGVGEPVNIPTEIINRFIPMMAQDIYDIAKDKDSIGKGLLMAIPGIFGAGSQTYGKTEYVEGVNKIGEPTSQIRPIQGLAETISEKTFGKQPLGSSSTWNIQTFIKQMKESDPQTQEQTWNRIVQNNPELAKKIKKVVEDEKKGITVKDQTLKEMGVASGDRAKAIMKEFNKLKTPQEKAALWDEYVRKGVITKDVAKQLKTLLQQ